MEKKNEVDKKEMERRKRTLRILKGTMIAIDVVAILVLIMQIMIDDISYYSYVLLIICNIITFLAKPSYK